MNWQYQYPFAFWLLLLIPVFVMIYLGFRWWQSRSMRKAGDPKLIRKLFATHSPRKSVFKFILLLIAFALGCIAFSNPRVPDDDSAEARKGIDLVVALDISNSMLATDIEPDRLVRAKYFITRLMEKMPNDRIALVEFAGNAYMQLPLTFDHDVASMYVTAASPKSITAQGTSISDALEKSALVFGEEEGRFQSIILITDGETHDEDALETATELASRGIMINTIGIGSPQGATIKDPITKEIKKDLTGQTVISRLNEDILKQIALATNGRYVHLQIADDAVKAMLDQYDGIEKKALGNTAMFTYQTFYMWFAAPMFLLLLVEIFIPQRKKLKQ